MVTEADREKKAIDWAQVRNGDTMDPSIMGAAEIEWLVQQLVHWPSRVNPNCTTNLEFLRCSAARLIEHLTCHRTASTAALTAEIQRLREVMDLAKMVREMVRAENVHARGIQYQRKHGLEDAPTSRDEVDVIQADLYAAWPAKRLDALIAALSTPSEVSEPVADESGGETMDWSEAVDFVDRFDLPISMVPDLVSPPNPTNGDAVREALVEMGEATFKEGLLAGWQSGRAGEAMPPEYVQASWERSDALATLAKHGGAEA